MLKTGKLRNRLNAKAAIELLVVEEWNRTVLCFIHNL